MSSPPVPLILTPTHATRLAGVHRAIQDGSPAQPENTIDVEADLEGEQECLPDPKEDDYELAAIDMKDAMGDEQRLEQLQTTILNASKGITDDTEKQYRRFADQCVQFLVSQQLIPSLRSHQFFSSQPDATTPVLIVAWIMDCCDPTWTTDGQPKSSDQARDSYSSAQKMRAAMTYMFGRVHQLGNLTWHKSETNPSKWLGNPSVSETVSSYMMSLKRRKVQAGEVAVSARAITPQLLQTLFYFNLKPENWEVREWRSKPDPNAGDHCAAQSWGGGRTRRLLWAAYSLAFICLLRFDEVLKIQVHDIKFIKKNLPPLNSETGSPRTVETVELTLPFRKTHQCGDIPPFVLYPLPIQYQHLCPVRAIAEWLHISQLTSGWLFPRLASGDRIDGGNKPMTTQQFLGLFRHNLVDVSTITDVKVNPAAYGTHSFRRGGCQFLHCNFRWPIRDICEWGGWSTDLSYLTIVKYIISESDDPRVARENFFNPDRPMEVRCPSCGRSCHCGW